MDGNVSEPHSRQLVHRDVSPRNVRCCPAGSAKLIDLDTNFVYPAQLASDLARYASLSVDTTFATRPSGAVLDVLGRSSEPFL